MNFKEFYKTKLVHEVSHNVANKIPAFLKGAAPFDHIFGDAKRIAEPMKKISDYHSKIRNSIIEDYELDFEKWVGFKITDKDKKNPIRIGKLLSQRKQSVEKYLKDAPNETELDNLNILSFRNQLQEIDQLLKVVNLQKTYVDAQKSTYYIIYSRLPIDVVRMSDHEWKSCHSEKGDYFYCALADATLNAGIAYVVTEEDLQKIDDLQKDEIFKDTKRDIEGIMPQARIRIRSVYDKNGNSLAVPATRVYKNNKFNLVEEFKQQVIEWAKRQDISDIDWDNTLTLRGGSYEDYGTKIDQMVKTIWGKDIDYDHKEEDEEEWRNEVRDDFENQEEQWWDEQRDDFDPDSIYNDVFGVDYYEKYFDIEYDINDGSLKLAYDIPDAILAKLKISPKWGHIGLIEKEWRYKKAHNPDDAVYARIQEKKLQFLIRKEYSARDYGEYYGPDGGGGRFREEKLKEDVQDYFIEILASFIGDAYMDEDAGFTELRMLMNDTLCKEYGVNYKVSDPEELEELETFVARRGHVHDELGQFSIPSFVPQIEPRGWIRELVGPVEQIKNLVEFSYIISDKIGKIMESKFDLPDGLVFDLFDICINIPDKMMTQRFDKTGKSTYSSSGIQFFNMPTASGKPAMIIKVMLALDDLDYIIDNGLTSMATKALVYLRDEFYDEYLKDAKNIIDLENTLNKLVPPNDYTELKKQGQMELDLSSINRTMTKFDEFIKKLYEEGFGSTNTGTDLSKRGPSNSTVTSAPKTGMTQPSGITPKYTNTAAKPMNPTAGSSANKPMDYGAIFSDPTALEIFNSDPKNFEGFRKHMKENPKNFETFKNSIKDPNIMTNITQMLLSQP